MKDMHDFEWTEKDRKSASRLIMGLFFFVFIYVAALVSCLVKKKTAEEYFQAGVSYMAERDFVKAEENFTHAIQKRKNYYEAYMERARVNEQLDSIHLCILDYTLILDSANLTVPKRSEIYFLRGSMYYLSLKDSLACKDYRMACELNNNTACDVIRKRCK